MKKMYLFVVVAFTSLQVSAQTTWKSDPAHSQVSFGITHNSISEVEGLFRDFNIKIVSSEANYSDAKYDMSVDIASVDTGIDMRDDHLRSDEFFDAEKYPKMTFKSQSVEKVSENKYKVGGDLTLRGITKPVELNVWYRGTNETEEGPVSGFQITGKVKRSDFDLGPKFPEAVLSDEVWIKVDTEVKKA